MRAQCICTTINKLTTNEYHMTYNREVKPAKYQRVTVLIPTQDYLHLQKISESERTSVSTVVRRFVGEAIDRGCVEV